MTHTDTVHLLRECNAGSKMAVSSIDEVIGRVKDEGLRKLLHNSKEHHEQLGNDIHAQLMKQDSEEKDPGAMAKSMSWVKTNFKLSMDESDSVVADLITDGCNMGIKSLHRYLNQYHEADETSKELCRKLSFIEEDLCRNLRGYL